MSQTTWHAGQHITLHWQATPRTLTSNRHGSQVTLRLTLTGPFPTVAALKQAISQGNNPAGVRSIEAAPLTVSDRTEATPASELDLPANLAPGHYNLGWSAGTGGNSVAASGILVIQ